MELPRHLPLLRLSGVLPLRPSSGYSGVASTTELPVLLLVDGAEVSERQLNDLFTALRRAPCACGTRAGLATFHKPSDSRSFFLSRSGPLSDLESQRFLATYSNTIPGAPPRTRAACAESESAPPFSLLLWARGVPRRLSRSRAVREIEAGATHWSPEGKSSASSRLHITMDTRPLPAQAFADSAWDSPRIGPLDLASALTSGALDLLD